MPILRHAETRYTKISTSVLQSSDISLKAKGLLCYMLSCSDNWKFSISGIAKVCGESKYSIEQSLSELASHGYHKKELKKDNGRFKEWEYWISDEPVFDLPDSEIPKQVNQDDNNNDKEIKTKSKSKENLFVKCSEVIETKFNDADIKEVLYQYLKFRISIGLTVEQWIKITEELFTIADTKEEVIEIVNKAYKSNWRSFYPLKKKSSNAYIDTIVETEKTEDGKLRDLYRETFSMTLPKDRPKYEDWLKENGYA